MLRPESPPFPWPNPVAAATERRKLEGRPMPAPAVLEMTMPLSETHDATTRGLLALSAPAYRLALRLAGSPEDAEDVVQQAYLSAIRQLRDGARVIELRAWFLRAVANLARLQARGEIHRRRREEAVQRTKEFRAERDVELASALRQAFEQLDEEYRLPVALCCEEGLSHREAADILDMPKRTLSRRVEEGLELLRKSLARAGYAAAPAAIIGGLNQSAPPVPATLTAAIEKIVSGEIVPHGTGAAALSAAKGGMAKKVLAGVVLAGALAGIMGLIGHIGPMSSPPPTAAPAPAGQPVREHFAFTNTGGYLDGPRREAVAGRRGCFGDAEDNIYSLTPHS
jgi:RNA polymerase sigma-70 factor (ECF subfamily)